MTWDISLQGIYKECFPSLTFLSGALNIHVINRPSSPMVCLWSINAGLNISLATGLGQVTLPVRQVDIVYMQIKEMYNSGRRLVRQVKNFGYVEPCKWILFFCEEEFQLPVAPYCQENIENICMFLNHKSACYGLYWKSCMFWPGDAICKQWKLVTNWANINSWQRILVKAGTCLSGQYHGCWWSGSLYCQGISRHITDLVILEYSAFSTRSFSKNNPAIFFSSNHTILQRHQQLSLFHADFESVYPQFIQTQSWFKSRDLPENKFIWP